MHFNDFHSLIAGVNNAWLCAYLGIGVATLRRWKTGKARVPEAVIKLLKIKLNGDLSALGGDDWKNFVIGPKDRLLYVPYFHRGFEPCQLSAMFFTTQDAWQDKRDVQTLQAELAKLRTEADDLRKREAFYRRQCQIEAKMGMMLARITKD